MLLWLSQGPPQIGPSFDRTIRHTRKHPRLCAAVPCPRTPRPFFFLRGAVLLNLSRFRPMARGTEIMFMRLGSTLPSLERLSILTTGQCHHPSSHGGRCPDPRLSCQRLSGFGLAWVLNIRSGNPMRRSFLGADLNATGICSALSKGVSSCARRMLAKLKPKVGATDRMYVPCTTQGRLELTGSGFDNVLGLPRWCVRHIKGVFSSRYHNPTWSAVSLSPSRFHRRVGHASPGQACSISHKPKGFKPVSLLCGHLPHHGRVASDWRTRASGDLLIGSLADPGNI